MIILRQYFVELERFNEDRTVMILHPTNLASTQLASNKDSDVFPEELLGLPPKQEVDFTIELQPGTSPILMAPHRLAPAELRKLKT